MNIKHYHKGPNSFNIIATDKYNNVHSLKLPFEQLPSRQLIDEINTHHIQSELQLLINNPTIKTIRL